MLQEWIAPKMKQRWLAKREIFRCDTQGRKCVRKEDWKKKMLYRKSLSESLGLYWEPYGLRSSLEQSCNVLPLCLDSDITTLPICAPWAVKSQVFPGEKQVQDKPEPPLSGRTKRRLLMHKKCKSSPPPRISPEERHARSRQRFLLQGGGRLLLH